MKHSVELLRIGYDDARPQITPTTPEEHVSELIVSAINRRCETGSLPTHLQRYEASDDAKIAHPTRRGKRRKRIDIRLVRVGTGRPTFEVEAKCLRTSSNPISAYSGKAGMMLFVNEEYALGKPIGCMLGYVQNRNATYWRGELQRTLASNPTSFGFLEGLDDTPGLAFSEAFSSRHQRVSGSEILIHHLLADCC